MVKLIVRRKILDLQTDLQFFYNLVIHVIVYLNHMRPPIIYKGPVDLGERNI